MTTVRRARSPPWANGTLMARKINNGPGTTEAQARDSVPGLGLHDESG
jgi:hypothetical protein